MKGIEDVELANKLASEMIRLVGEFLATEKVENVRATIALAFVLAVKSTAEVVDPRFAGIVADMLKK